MDESLKPSAKEAGILPPEAFLPVQRQVVSRLALLVEDLDVGLPPPLNESKSQREERIRKSGTALQATVDSLTQTSQLRLDDPPNVRQKLSALIEGKDFSRLDERMRKVYVTLAGLHLRYQDKPEELIPAVLYNNLLPYQEEKPSSSSGFSFDFNELLNDLSRAATFRREGIKGINEELTLVVTQLQRKNLTQEEREENIRWANEVLERPVNLFPHVVKGIRVKLKPKAVEDEPFQSSYAYDCGKGRRDFADFAKHQQQQTGSPLTDLCFPSPADRDYHRIKFQTVHPLKEEGGVDFSKEIPCLVLPTEKFYPAYFTIDEIESIGFEATGQYTPYFSKNINDTPPSFETEERMPWLTRYLKFRGFSPSDVSDKNIRESPRDGLRLRPAPPKYHVSLLGDKVSGFFLYQSEDQPNSPILVEVKGYRLPINKPEKARNSKFIWNDIAKRQKEGKPLPREVQIYQGEDAILSRLAAVPVSFPSY